MAQLQRLAAHIGLRVAIVLGCWGVKAAFSRLRPKGQGVKAKVAKRAPSAAHTNSSPKHSKQTVVNIIWDPSRQYIPNNPKWLVEASQWVPDAIPAELLPECPALTKFQEAAAAGAISVQFGSRECKQQLFALDPSFTYLNHGSYGAAFRLGLEVQDWYRQQLEAEPVRFMETTGMAGLVKALASAAAFVGSDWRDVVPVSNATAAVKSVVQSIKLRKGDLMLMSNTTYPAVRSTLAAHAAAAGAGVADLILEVADLMDPGQLLAAFRQALVAYGRRIKLVVVDHVVSFPPVVLPVQEICQLCRDAGVPVLVDGAHAVGALPRLDVPSLGCTYYTTNLHKWLCTPKGAALLWVHPSKQDLVHPLATSHGYGCGFRTEFLWQGTNDMTAWLAAKACISVLQLLQPEQVSRYNHNLVKQGATLLQQTWGTSLILGIGTDGSTAGMVAVQMPWPIALVSSSTSSNKDRCNPNQDNPAAAVTQVNSGQVVVHKELQPGKSAEELSAPTADAAVALNKLLRNEYKIEVPVACVAGMLWCRISAQIYNSLQDYQRLADVVQQLKCQASEDAAAAS